MRHICQVACPGGLTDLVSTGVGEADWSFKTIFDVSANELAASRQILFLMGWIRSLL